MEDPWADPWGDPSKHSSSSSESPIATSSTWSAPSVSAIHGDNEDDISTPSWSTDPTTHWDATNVKDASLWGNHTSVGWNSTHSTYGGISFGNSAVEEPKISFSTTSKEISQTSFSIPAGDHPPPSLPLREPPNPPPLLSPVNSSFTPAHEIIDDGFGTFETAGDKDDPDLGWPSPPVPGASLLSTDVDAWGATWQDANSASVRTEVNPDEFDDAWERAKQRKEKQDLHAPSAMLTAIICNLEALSDDLWPDGSSPVTSELDQRSVDIESLGLSPIYRRLVPDEMTLPPNPQFSKTFVSKRLTETLKTTRHIPITRSSPMAIYMASKGSTSWEVSVKSRPNAIQDDLAPAGWRVVDNSKDEALSTGDEKKKTGGGLFSFFGRRTTSVSESQSPRRPLSPTLSTNTSSSQQSSSPRASADGTKTTNAAQSNRATPTPSLTTPIAAPQSTEPGHSNPSIIAAPMVQSTTSEVIVQGSTPPPSAVSRFLGKFSSRSAKSTANKDALALSSDDLEFLSDVPTLVNEAHNSKDLDVSSMMIRSPPMPAALPSPLPPPTQILRNSPAIQNDQHDPFAFFDPPIPESKSTPIILGPLQTPTLLAPTPPLTYQRPIAPSSTSTPHPSSSLTGPQGGHGGDRSRPSVDYPTMSVNAGRTPAITQAANRSTKSSNSPTGLLPLPPSQRHGPYTSSQRIAPAQPPLSNDLCSSMPILPPPPPATKAYSPFSESRSSVDYEDDEFSDFLSSPTHPTPSIPLSFDIFATGGLQPGSTYATNNKPSTAIISFDNFDDFVSPPKADVPPQPPTKLPALYPTSRSLVPVTSKDIPPLPSQRPTHARKVSRQADHARTLSLLETAAARKTWLSPPSPLPQALPPPGVSNGHSSGANTRADGSTMQAQQAQAVAHLSPQLKGSSQLWTLPPPPSVSHLKSGAPSDAPPPQPLPVAATKSATAATTGGLSAQDLSFFEGL